MRKKPVSQSGLLHPRSLAALLLGSLAMLLAMASFAATPDHGTLTDTSGPVSYTAGPFTTSNPTPVIEVDNGPECGTGQPCDDFKLTVSLPSGFAASHPNAAIKATMSWTDSGTGQSDYDIYIYKTPRGDCNPNDCTSTDGSQQADAQSASGSNPEVATLAVKSDTSTYTIVVVPFTSTGETVNVTIELLPGDEVVVNPNAGPTDPNFGRADPSAPGVPRFMNFYAPAGTSAEESSGEFNIGFNPKTGRIMTMNAGPVWRITPPELLAQAKPECCEGLWEDKSDRTTDFGLDPILWTDQPTGRTFVSNSTAGANAVYAYTDDDGDSYTEGGIAPPNGGADHETIGSGPYPALLSVLATPVNSGEAVYYCSQDIVGPASCQRSDTLGASYGPGVLAYNGQGSGTPGGTDCGGLHGHLHVAPDGTAWLPVNQCGGSQGGVFSTDGGVTWTEFKVPNAVSQPFGADPSIAIDSDNTIYYAYVNNEPVAKGAPPEGHARVAVGKLDLTTNTIAWSNDFDIGTTHGIKNAVEIEAVGGSSGRAGVGFLGTNLAGDYQANDFPGRWYAFIATTYDKGQSWVTVNATPNDPVQSKTGVWQQGGGAQDRNLLDFNEITVDNKGRVLYGYSDGCVSATCISGSGGNDFVAYMRVARQTGGKSLFASNDVNTDTTVPLPAKPPCLSGTRDVVGSHLTWKAPDDGGSGISDYFIYRGTSSGAESLTPLGHTGGRTSFLDTTADPTVSDYFYIVKAVTSLGFGAASNEIDLQVTPVVKPALPYSCSGENVVTDFAGDAKDPAPNFELGNTDQADITAISFGASKDTLTTKMAVKNLTLTPSAGTTETYYFVIWTAPDGKTYATLAISTAGQVSYSYGVWDDANKTFVSGTSQSTTGTFNQGPNGTVTVDVPRTAVGNPTIPVATTTDTPAVRQPFGLTIAGGGALGTGVTFTAPMDRAPNVDVGYGQSWAVCLPPNAAPTAVLTATPNHGPAPLTVTLDGSGSTDPDAGDTIASYTFEFGDGSDPVTQSSPTIQHTYSSAGEFNARLTVTDSHGLVSLNTALAPVEVNAVLRNISTRANVQTGDDVLIGGFIVTGSESRNIIVRAIGPSIQNNGQPLAGTLQDPTLELHDSTGVTIATNDNWKTDDTTGQSQQSAVEGTGIPPSDDRESAIVKTLAPGKYTAIVRGKGGTTGLALVEAYDLNPFATSKLANISTRGTVGAGDNVMIGGFVAGPSTAAPATVLIRGIGPSLASQNVPTPLQDPTLDLYNGDGTKIRSNDNWQDTQEDEVNQTGIPPSDPRESAIVIEIAPGNYTAILSGKNGTGGNGLVEIYSIN